LVEIKLFIVVDIVNKQPIGCDAQLAAVLIGMGKIWGNV